jgi:hypothetical protein
MNTAGAGFQSRRQAARDSAAGVLGSASPATAQISAAGGLGQPPGAADQPGGQAIRRPPSTWACTWNTVWPASGPVLKTTR